MEILLILSTYSCQSEAKVAQNPKDEQVIIVLVFAPLCQ